jgi:hypothetical protein
MPIIRKWAVDHFEISDLPIAPIVHSIIDYLNRIANSVLFATNYRGTTDHMAKMQKSTANGRQKRAAWTKEHVRDLKGHSKSKTPVAKIAKLMKRSEGAIRQKALALDISIGHRR